MLSFKKTGNTITTAIAVKGFSVEMNYSCSDSLYSTLLIEEIKKDFGCRLALIREYAYNQGWKDAKSKKVKKKTFFSENFDNSSYVGF